MVEKLLNSFYIISGASLFVSFLSCFFKNRDSRRCIYIFTLTFHFIFLPFQIFAQPKNTKFLGSANKYCLQQYKIPSMGTLLELQIVDICSQEHGQFLKTARDILNNWESEFSLYQPQSPISQLNQKGLLANPSTIFIEGIQTSLQHLNRTLGQFNILVEPILKEIRRSFAKDQKPPDLSTIEGMKGLLQIENLKLNHQPLSEKPSSQFKVESKVEFAVSGSAITLDGIVKGIAVDKIAELANSEKFQGYLINFSGNMRWKGAPPGKKHWNLMAWNPVTQKAYKIETPQEGAMASSGPEHNSFDEKYAWHHLINPKTLRPANYWRQTTIVGPSAAECDVLSTATFVSENDLFKKILKNYPDYRAYTVDLKGQTKLF